MTSRTDDNITGEHLISTATRIITQEAQTQSSKNVNMRPDYIEVFDPETFAPIRGPTRGAKMVIAGAMWVGKTRLIDNLLLEWDGA